MTHLVTANLLIKRQTTKQNANFNILEMHLNFARKKKSKKVSFENYRVKEIRKETQLDVNLELSDVPKYLIDFLKKHL